MDGFDGRIEVERCDTIPKLFWHQVKARDQRTAFREKKLGIWRATSWPEYGERARAVGMGLVQSPEEFGSIIINCSGAIPAGLLTQSTPQISFSHARGSCDNAVAIVLEPFSGAQLLDLRTL